MSTSVKVVTLNTWCGMHYDAMVQFLKMQDPDVILLQEVCSGESIEIDFGVSNQYEKLRAALGVAGIFVPGFHFTNFKSPLFLGQAILTKHPIAQVAADFYMDELKTDHRENLNCKFPGYLLKAHINIHGRKAWFISTHFLWSLYPEITTKQETAVENLLACTAELEECILGGDFNVTKESSIYQKLRTQFEDARPQEVINTLHPEIHKLKGSQKLAVDFMFHKGPRLNLLRCVCPEVPISDHLPLVAEYELH